MTSLTTSIEKIYNINFFQNENMFLASGNKGYVELWDIRKNKMLKSKELSSEPIVYGSRTFNSDNNILLGLENWKGVILDHNLEVIEQKCLREEGHSGVVKSIELGNGKSFFGFKNGQIEIVETIQKEDKITKKVVFKKLEIIFIDKYQIWRNSLKFPSSQRVGKCSWFQSSKRSSSIRIKRWKCPFLGN